MPEKPPKAPQTPTAPPGPEPVSTPPRRNCGTMLVHHRLMRTDATYAKARAASENHHVAVLQGQRAVARSGVTSIPVVVHVVHNTTAQNISEAQITSQIEVLNRDFRRTNPDVASTPAPFAALTADARILFTLATRDPDGNATNGITRTETTRSSFTDNDEIKSAATGGVAGWPADRYLNIWTAPRLTSIIGDLLGYAQFPGGPAATDGVVILHSAFGTTGTAAAPYNLGRTATHEIGHFLNLRHIWGDDDEGCNGSDFVDDTPNQADSNRGTPAFPHITCNNGPNGDMFMNYMDYVDDAAMFMFTTGQVVRIQACLDGDRGSLGSMVIAPTNATADQPPTFKPSDDQPTMKFADDPITLKVNDDGPTFKPSDDQPTTKFTDDPVTLKVNDDGPTSKFGDDFHTDKVRDDHPTLKTRDDPIRLKHLDDGIHGPGGFGPGPGHGLPGPGRGGQPGAAPFVLSTPHHSMAWMQSFPQAAYQARVMSEQQIKQYEDTLTAYAQAEAAGQLSPAQRQEADALYHDYLRLIEEFKQTFGG